jgi:prepilin-type N-terminal cleavage/methylation domain-containing protein
LFRNLSNLGQTLKAAKLQFKYTTQESSTQLRALALQGDNYCKGFTLAEVLVTLAIIGVVSAITIPILITSVQKQRYTAALQKNFSVIANVYKLLDADGTTMEIAFPGTDNGAAALNMIAPKLNIIKNCDSSMGCWYNSPQYFLVGTVATPDIDAAWNGIGGKAILADGTMILIVDGQSSPSCTTPSGTGPLLQMCGYVYIDVNGAKSPNTLGRDVFMFWVTKTGLYPFGSNGDSYNCAPGSSGCAYRVLTQGMNY